MSTAAVVQALKAADQDFEWYPTTRRMVEKILACLATDTGAILGIGAGDGRVLVQFAEKCPNAKLYAIEKSTILQQRQPENVIPVGTEFFEQDLMSLPVDVVFCNPPYSQFETWAARIIETAHAHQVFLVLPQRWESSPEIQATIKAREAKTRVIHQDDFLDAERKARAVVHVVQVTLTPSGRYWSRHPEDPFDRWFDQNIDTFDLEAEPTDPESSELARLHTLDTIAGLVAAFNEDYARMQDNYKAIFRLDYALFKELGVDKNSVREGLKKRMAGLKHTYWSVLFDNLTAVTTRLTTSTKKRFLDLLNGQKAIAFTASNAYAVSLWAIKYANQYFDTQLVEVFRKLSTHDGVLNYVSNQRTWEKDGWRYNAEQFSHYALDYRVVLDNYSAILRKGDYRSYESPGGLHNSCHEIIDDLIAVFGNLGFLTLDVASRQRTWTPNVWQNFMLGDGRVLFQAKGFLNGNLHFRFLPEAIKALNIEAGRLLGWLRAPGDVVTELGYHGYQGSDARYFGTNQRLGPAAVKMLTA